MRSPRLWLGSILLLLGVIWIFDAAGVVNAGWVIGGWWPLALIALGLESVIANRRLTFGPVLAIGFGAVLLVDRLGIVELGGMIWPLVVTIAGIWLLTDLVVLRDRPRQPREQQDVLAVMGGVDASSRSDHFVRGSASALFGGATLDLREATLAPGARVDTLALFGGVDVIVPVGWRVETSVVPIFGGFDDKTRGPTPVDPDAPVLKISGLAAFGGIEVKNPKPMEAAANEPNAAPSAMGGRELR